MSTREEELERAVADLRNVIASLVNHLAAGGHVRRNDALHRDLKRVHRHTRDVLTTKISGGASRWFEKTMGERVLALTAELERHQLHAVMVDKALDEGNVLRALSDEAVAAEYDRRQQHLVSAHNLAGYQEMFGAIRTASDEDLFAELERRGYDNPLRTPAQARERDRRHDDLVDAQAAAFAHLTGTPERLLGPTAFLSENAPCDQRGCTNVRPRSATWCAWHGPNRLRDASP